MPRPNLFIVGAPKAGTTAMYEYLRNHPEVYMSAVKELNYFGADVKTYSPYHKSRTTYLEWFTKAKKEKIIGEASVWYLYSNNAAREIYKFNPKAKIIIMLRNPADLIHSLHSELLFKGYEDEKDLTLALYLEKLRKEGKHIPKICRLPKVLYYSEVVNYYPQVKRYFDTFGKRNVKVIIFADFVNTPEKTYTDTLKFLGLPSTHLPDFNVVNPSKTVRNEFVRNVFQNPTPTTLRMYERLIPIRFRPSLIKLVLTINSKGYSKHPLNPKLKDSILHDQLTNIDKLSKLIGKDLSRWKNSAY